MSVAAAHKALRGSHLQQNEGKSILLGVQRKRENREI